MKTKILTALVVLSVMVVAVTIVQAANNVVVVDDFEAYTAGQPINGQGGWTAPGCSITVENVSGNNILRSSSCGNSQGANLSFASPFTDHTVYSYIQFKGRITTGNGANSSSLVRLISPNEQIAFGIVNNPSLGIDHQLRFYNSNSGAIHGPKLTPGTWYDFRLEVDWSYISPSGGFGLATLWYKPATEATWLTSPRLTNLELDVVNPAQFNKVRARMDGLNSRRGEMDDIVYLAQSPEIEVQGQGQTINTGDNTPSLADDTDFGATTVGTPLTKTYTIHNSGSFTLTLTSPITVPPGFSAGSFGTTQLPPGGTTTVDIQLDGTTAGTFSGPVQITSNDLDKSPYTFTVQGIVDAPPSTSSLTIVKEASPADGTDFAFTSNLPGYSSFNLDDETTQTDTVSQTLTFSNLVTGTYIITEILPADWQLDNVTCTGGSIPSNLTNETLSVTLGVDEEVVCTFTNSLVSTITSIDGLLDLETTLTHSDSTPAPNAPQGSFTITATFRNVSTATIKYIHFEVAQLTNGNLLLNADDGPAGPGGIISVPSALLGTDEELSPNETFTIVYEIGLASPQRFNFFVDAYGVVMERLISVSPPPPPNDDDNLDIEIIEDDEIIKDIVIIIIEEDDEIIEDNIQADDTYRTYMPLIIK